MEVTQKATLVLLNHLFQKISRMFDEVFYPFDLAQSGYLDDPDHVVYNRREGLAECFDVALGVVGELAGLTFELLKVLR